MCAEDNFVSYLSVNADQDACVHDKLARPQVYKLSQ